MRLVGSADSAATEPLNTLLDAVHLELLAQKTTEIVLDLRRLVPTALTAVAEIATVDSVEGLLLRPERIPGVIP